MAAATLETPQAAANRFLTSLHHPSHILVAISGGSDSTGLLMALADTNRSQHLFHTLSAVTVDHGLRSESTEEALSVAALCRRLGIPHLTRRWEGSKPNSGLMAAAREARYELLAAAAADLGADVIVTGHTLDDQQETLAMRGARVSGRDRGETARGIADAVLFDRRVWIVRPFLKCRRADIRAALVTRGIGWIDDPSNVDLHYERVRVRALLGVSEVAAIIDDGGSAAMRLSQSAAAWVGESVTIHAALLGCVDIASIDTNSPVFAYGLSYLATVFGGQPFALGHEKLQRILAFIADGLPGRRTAGGVVFDLRRGGLYLMRESRNIAALRLPPGARGVWDGRFDVHNDGPGAVHIVANGEARSVALPAGLPGSAAMRAAASAPSVLFEADNGPKNDGAVTITPRLAPFDRFLTRFDLTLADQLSRSFGRTAYLSPPL
ncbi:MAG: tRNA lysidine(34) synthetase TilS [Rhizobium sp.]